GGGGGGGAGGGVRRPGGRAPPPLPLLPRRRRRSLRLRKRSKDIPLLVIARAGGRSSSHRRCETCSVRCSRGPRLLDARMRGHDRTDKIPCCSSSGSAIPVRATPATDTISVSWRLTRSPSATASVRGGGAFRASRQRGRSAASARCCCCPAPT